MSDQEQPPIDAIAARKAKREAMRRDAAELHKVRYLTPLEHIERQISEEVTAEALRRKQQKELIGGLPS